MLFDMKMRESNDNDNWTNNWGENCKSVCQCSVFITKEKNIFKSGVLTFRTNKRNKFLSLFF